MKFTVVLVLAALVLSIGLVAVPVSAAGDAPAGFCKGGVAWPIRGQTTLSDPKCGTGVFVLEIELRQSRFNSFAEAEKSRNGRDSTYWFETQVGVVATMTLATATVPVVTGQLAMNWQNFCQGAAHKIVEGGKVSNVELGKLDPACGEGTYLLIEPWRPGCSGDVTKNPNCNVGKSWRFTSWSELVKWMAEGRWTEGSVWFVPDAWSSETTPATATPTVRPATPTPKPTATPTRTPIPSLKGTLPSNISGIKWWGWVLIALGAIALAVGLFFLIRWLVRGVPRWTRRFRRSTAAPAAGPQP